MRSNGRNKMKAGQRIFPEGHVPVIIESYRKEYGQRFYNVVIGNYRVAMVREVDLTTKPAPLAVLISLVKCLSWDSTKG